MYHPLFFGGVDKQLLTIASPDRPHGYDTSRRTGGETQLDDGLPWKCPKRSRSRALASMFLQVGETCRPRFPPVYSAILGAGYPCLHFSSPLSLSAYFLLSIAASFVHSRWFSSSRVLRPYHLSVWKTYIKVALSGGDTFRQLLRYPTLLSSMWSDSLTYLKKPWCNTL